MKKYLRACTTFSTSLSIFEEIVRSPFLLSHHIHGVCKKKKSCNRIIEKEKFLLLINVYVFYVLELNASKNNFRLSV